MTERTRTVPPRAPARTDAHASEAGLAALELVVTRLHDEVEGLRTALRYRAVIEQAKGILVARLGISPDVAFRRLVARSQQHNRKLTTIAAAIVAHALANTDGRGDVPDEAPGEGTDVQLAAAAFAAAPGIGRLTETVAEELGDLGVAGVVLAAAETDGTLRLLHDVGFPPGTTTGWERVALTADTPLAEAARTGRPVLLPDRATRVRQHPGTRLIDGAGEASASLPLQRGAQLVGVLGLSWDRPFDFDTLATKRLLGTADRLVPRLVGLLAGLADDPVQHQVEPGYDRWFHDFLDTLPVPVVLLEPQRADGRVVDLVVVHVNAASDAGPAPVGRGVLERWPQVARTDLFERVRRVVEGGTAAADPAFVVPPAPGGPTLILEDLRITRVGSLVAISCRGVRGGDDGQPERSKR